MCSSAQNRVEYPINIAHRGRRRQRQSIVYGDCDVQYAQCEVDIYIYAYLKTLYIYIYMEFPVGVLWVVWGGGGGLEHVIMDKRSNTIHQTEIYKQKDT